MANRWTDEQKQAIEERNGNILVSAAAGSGKTAVLVERIFTMLTDRNKPLNMDNLLVVTFTNAAAAEMKERVEDRLLKSLDEDPDNDHVARQLASMGSAQIMTIHSFCLQVIRTHFNEIDLDPAFRIGEETELTLMRGDVAQSLMEAHYEAEDPAFLEFVECFAKGKMDKGIEELILQVYEYSRSYPQPKKWLSDCLKSFQAQDEKDLSALPSVRFLMDYVQKLSEEMSETLEEGLALCREPDGPVFYEEMLAADQKVVEGLKACRSFDDYYEHLSQLSFMALSRKRMPDASPQKKEQVKAIRTFVKDTLNRLKEDYFSKDAKTTASQLHRMLPQMETLTALVEEFSQAYQAAKGAKNMVDFGDLEHFALDILTRTAQDGTLVPSPAAQELSEQYAEILIDEYQDSNQVQETILTSISRERLGKPNIFMVGDVKQSIYKFRLARPELFMEKYETYPALGDQYRRIELHKNFRSRPVVLEFVNFLFYRLMGRDLGDIDYTSDAALYPGAQFPSPSAADPANGGADGAEYGSYAQVLLVTPEPGTDGGDESDDDLGEKTARELEAGAIALRIREMVEGPKPFLVTDKESGELRPARYGDMVILLRTMSGWADTFVKVLGEENISAQAETVTGFFSASEIRVILACLNVIDNPRQDIPLAAVLKSPVGNLTDEELAMVSAVYGPGSSGSHDLYDECQTFLRDESTVFLEEYYSTEAILAVREKLGHFMDMLADLRRCVPYTPIHELILKVYDVTGYYACASAMPGGAKRRANLDMLVEKAVDYENTSYQGLFNFSRYIERLKQYQVDFGEAAAGDGYEDTVRIMSIHKSKGLEYPIVFVAGLGKAFNQQDARSSLLIHADFGFGPDVIDTQWRLKAPTIQKKILAAKTILENLGEELRVLYVALTRAREMLVLTGYVADMEKSLSRWSSSSGQGKVLPFNVRQSAKSFLDWIMPVILKHRSAHDLLEAYGFASPVFHPDYDADVSIRIREIRDREIFRGIAHKGANAVLKREILVHWDTQKVYLPQMHEEMDQYLSWKYPFASELGLHTKMTVSELKRMSQLAPETEETGPEDFTAVSEEPAAQAVALSRQERMERAALRGTTVHKILERMDISSIGSLKDVYGLMDRLTAAGIIDEVGASLVYVPGLYQFARSEIARRMAKAKANGALYREKQFVIGVPVSQVYRDREDDDMVLIQGIIDAWFIEDSQAVIVDYKTDFVPDDGESLVKKYKTQLDYYGLALEQMTGLKVKEKIIYSLSLGKEIFV